MKHSDKANLDYQKNQIQYDWLFNHIIDETSQIVLANIIEYRITKEELYIQNAIIESEDNIIEFVNEVSGRNGTGVDLVLNEKNFIEKGSKEFIIDVSDVVSHIWEIPRLINFVNTEYVFCIRQVKRTTLLYAMLIKDSREKNDNNILKRVVVPNGLRDWENADLLKDCGIIPYLLHKNFGCECIMLGASKEDSFSNLKYVKGLKLQELDNSSIEAKEKYVEDNAKDIDLLVLYGAYPTYYKMVEKYKANNPSARIYLALDANVNWMDRILWREQEFSGFLDRCDIIASSGRSIRNHLLDKWRWPIIYVPNGFYNYSGYEYMPDFNKKNNVILTVARLGIPEKATDVLMLSFAKIANEIPDWRLKLVGSIDPRFDTFIEEFWDNYPELEDRIIFTGPILDRDKLYQEYLDAKIFALPSRSEGMPNVIGEALMAGDVTAVTKWGEYKDATNYGECGLASEIDDVEGFASILLELCHRKDLNEMSLKAREYADSNLDMNVYVTKIYEMLTREEE